MLEQRADPPQLRRPDREPEACTSALTRPGLSTPEHFEAAKPRITVRLDRPLARLVGERCRAEGRTVSDIVRGALEFTLRAEDQVTEEVKRTASRPRPAYVFPRELHELLPRYRAFGAEIRKERRRCFGALLAICEVVREHSRSAEDLSLCAEISRLGKILGLLR